MKTMKKRDISYEIIRVIAMFFIVFDHNLSTYLPKDITTFLEPFFVVGVTLFFMLSGKFAFKLNLEDKSLYKKYYWKKVIGLIVPMLVYMAIKNWHVMVYNQHLTVTPLSYIKHFGIALVNGFSYMEYWFLYTLIALLVAVPFTARMMQNLRAEDKKAFLAVSTILATLSMIIPSFLNVKFAIDYYFIGNIFFFFAGYIVEDIFSTKTAKRNLYITGFLSLVMTLLMVKLGLTNGYKSYSPFYMYFTLAMFTVIHELGKKIPAKFEKLVLLLGKHSLGVYMIHMIVLYAVNDAKIFPGNIIGFLASTILIIAISTIISIVLDNTIIKWLQKLTIKIFKLENVVK